MPDTGCPHSELPPLDAPMDPLHYHLRTTRRPPTALAAGMKICCAAVEARPERGRGSGAATDTSKATAGAVVAAACADQQARLAG